MSDVRWKGFSHQEIYDAVRQGPGAAISTSAVGAWTSTEALITQIDQRIMAAMTGSQSGWEGSADICCLIRGGAMTVCHRWMRPVDVARRRPYRATTPAGRHATRGGVTRLTHRRSRKSSR